MEEPTFKPKFQPGSLGITIEVLEYRPVTGEIVTVKRARHWGPKPKRAALERPVVQP